MDKFINGIIMRAAIFSTLFLFTPEIASAHEFSDIPDMASLNQAEQHRRCVAVMAFFNKLQHQTIGFDFEYQSGPGPEAKTTVLQNLSGTFNFHARRAVLEFLNPAGKTTEGEDIGVRLLESVEAETDLYNKALVSEGTPDAEGRLPMRDTREARQLLSHDLMSCFTQFYITKIDQ